MDVSPDGRFALGMRTAPFREVNPLDARLSVGPLSLPRKAKELSLKEWQHFLLVMPELLLGFSINLLTLLALVLAIGLVVDDAIVVLENIHRRMEQYGESRLVAAYRGTRQVGFAVVATTLVLVTHDRGLAERCDRVLSLDAGRLVSDSGGAA